jgi:hypothetical protein
VGTQKFGGLGFGKLRSSDEKRRQVFFLDTALMVQIS